MMNNQENKSKDSFKNKVNMIVEVSGYKGNFRFTIPAKENRKKLIQYILQNYYFNSLYSRIKNFESSSIQQFAKKHNL